MESLGVAVPKAVDPLLTDSQPEVDDGSCRRTRAETDDVIAIVLVVEAPRARETEMELGVSVMIPPEIVKVTATESVGRPGAVMVMVS